jgi:protein O-mannosyl-transferase
MTDQSPDMPVEAQAVSALADRTAAASIESPYLSPRAPLSDPVSAPSIAVPALSGSRAVVFAVCGLLGLAVALVYCQTAGYDFVNYDDDQYVYDNSHINGGLTWEGLSFYAVHYHAYTYHPLSTYSHMLDCQLFGVKAGGHHAVNAALHAIAAALLFLLLRRMTGRLWPSALAAAVFALHPLRVQSVAWISERKDVLSGVFFVLTLLAYVRYVRGRPTRGRYAVVCLLYALGLLAKPMLVTLPMVLLLLDYWPLGRWKGTEQGAGSGEQGAGSEDPRSLLLHLIVEKIPLFLLSFGAAALTVHTQGNAIQTLDYISWKARIANALVSYANYIGCFFWPRGLAILYPHPRTWTAPESLHDFLTDDAVHGAVILLAVSAVVFFARRKAPYLLVGWLWYLGMLVPVIGLIQVGGQKMADRYTYLPQIGVVIALAWAVTEFSGFLIAQCAAAARACCRAVIAIAAAAILAALAAGAWQETGYWRNSETLWKRDLDMKYANIVAYYNLGLTLAASNLHEQAIEQFENACKITPDDEDSLIAFGQSLEALGRIDSAVAKYGAALNGNRNASIPNDRLARIALKRGKDHDALLYWRHALIDDPDNVSICTQAAWLLAASPEASVRNGKSAVVLAQKVVGLGEGKSAAAFDLLAAAQAEAGRYSDAVESARKGQEMAIAGRDDELARDIRTRLALYEARKPYRRGVEKK